MITKDKTGENVPQLGITEATLDHCNMVNKIINKIEDFRIHLFQANYLVNYYTLRKQTLFFQDI